MSKGLEELNKIKNYKEWTTVATMGGYERTKVKLAYNDELKESFIVIKKELKALEIIKPLVHLTKDTTGCWLWLGLNAVQITQEQYDSLEKVLL